MSSDAALDGWAIRRTAVALEIERAALKLFLQRDPDAVTVEEIAEAAGVSRRTFFRYFAARDDLLAATPTRALLQTAAAVRDRPAEESIVEALLATARSETPPQDDPELLRLSGQVMARAPQAWARALARLRRETDLVFAEMAAHRLRKAGRDPAGAAVIGAALAAVVTEVYREWVASGCAEPLAERLEKGVEGLKAALGPPSV